MCRADTQVVLSADGLARKLGVPAIRGRQLLQMHQETFPTYWRWSQSVQDAAMLTGQSRTVFGWTVRVGEETKPNSLRNFPMQANGAEMMRLAACLATERGVEVCCPVHDAFLIEAPADAIEAETERMQAAMREASELVLPGFPLRTDAKVVKYPDRYADERGRRMWETVQRLLAGPPGVTVSHAAA
jgi:DNA polymerase I